ncbi:tyrosine-protein kinase receptor Tie-1-like [Amphiura filiformis]|uniref:tyrosine-protein kinase receptor Tie-1-like n=1 Tax=Amphiura filiformis TaxID=82378 RepID=UPI003B2190AF
MYTTKSDVWSFGILLWEIATFGGTPYSDIDTKNISRYLRSGYRMPNPNCGEDMYTLMSSCWLEDPDARPSFQDIVNVLNSMAEQRQIYLSTHYYENFKHAAIRSDKDDR